MCFNIKPQRALADLHSINRPVCVCVCACVRKHLREHPACLSSNLRAERIPPTPTSCFSFQNQNKTQKQLLKCFLQPLRTKLLPYADVCSLRSHTPAQRGQTLLKHPTSGDFLEFGASITCSRALRYVLCAETFNVQPKHQWRCDTWSGVAFDFNLPRKQKVTGYFLFSTTIWSSADLQKPDQNSPSKV